MQYAGPFARPVDPSRCPDYRLVIRHPLDLGTIQRWLGAGVYGADLDLFAANMRLVFDNAQFYNVAGHRIHNIAAALRVCVS